MVSIRVRLIGADKAKKRLIKIMTRIPKESEKTVRASCITGRNFAKAIAPKHTGALVQAITFRTGGKTRNAFGYVESKMPGAPKRPGNTTPYHRMMHGLDSPDISGRIKTGDPKYMFKTTDFLRKHFPEQMRKAVHTALRK